MGGLSIRWKIRGVAVFFMWFALVSGNEDETLELPFCNPEKPNSVDTRIRPVFVSTLDGTFSSLNAVDGSSLWNIDTGPGPLLSSSIHQLELSNDAEWVRLIPSLTGGLYKFNKKHIEAIPISADKLLEPSPFLFSDDLHIAGGKEIRTYGVDIGSGTVLYECSMSGCINRTNGLYYNQDVLVVHRYTQTVRAVHARSGVERWNFSVGQHDLNFMTDRNVGCKNEVERQNADNFEIKAVIPDGVICAVNKLNPNEIIWKYKFQAPIASAWILEDGKFQSIDLFSGTLKDENNGYITPSLYIGMHKKQLYIQESSITRDAVHMTNFLTEESNYPRIPWNPIPATDSHLGIDGPLPKEDSTAIQVFDASTTANSVLYASEYVNGYGFFLQSKVDQLLDCSTSDDGNSTITTEENTDEQETPVEIIIVSLWYWWKEVVIISITTALLVNLFTQRFMHSWQTRDRQDIRKEIIFVEKCVVAKPENDSGVVLPIQNSLSENNQVHSTGNFMSRYLNDFDPVQCLGRGGFGVVFEAKNKIDECSYAVKRIALPNNKESRERVMREVKALAKLDHQHIVRYFNAWVEFPPPGWQEIQDNNIFKGFKDSTTVDLSELSKGYTSDVSKSVADKTYNSESLHHSDPEVSDSFIVFDASRHSSKCSPQENSSAYLDIVKSKCGDSHSVIDKYSHASLNNNYNENGENTKNRPSLLNVQNDFSYLPPVSSTVYLYIQMQLCHRESLREWLRDNVISRDTQRVLQMFEQIVQAVEYVHLQGLIHRDLKPSNIFFSLNGQVKVGDFGLVTAMVEDVADQRTPSSENKFNPDDKHTAQVGTETYMSPEQLKGLPYDYKVDIYSLGLILFELLVPFSTQMERHKTLTDLRNNKFPADFQKKFKDEFELLKLMLSHSPDQRPTTYGIRARPPLNLSNSTEDYEWHFELPSRKRASSQSASFSNSSSVESWENV